MGVAQGQTYSANFVDGSLYFKIKGGYSSSVQNRTGFQTSSLPYIMALENIFSANSVTAVEKEFGANADTILTRIYKVDFADFSQADTLVAQIAALPEVDYAEKVPVYYTSVITNPTNDPLATVAQQWSLDRVNAWANCIIGTTIPTIRPIIAILDNAVLTTHEDLIGNIWTEAGTGIHGADFSTATAGAPVSTDPNPPMTMPTMPAGSTTTVAEYFQSFSHGTHCAGIAGARSDNSIGVASVSRNYAQIMGIKLVSSTTTNPGVVTGDVPAAIAWAVAHGANVISMSFGNSYLNGFDSPTNTLQVAIDAAYNAGVVCIAAAGNANVSNPAYPANCNHVIAVASTDNADIKSSFSNYGTWIDVSAPGSDILSCTVEENNVPNYGFKSGTSMACPMVAGLAGLSWVVNGIGGLTGAARVNRVQQIIKSTALNIDATNPNFVNRLGAGRINLSNLCAASTVCTPPITLTNTTTPMLFNSPCYADIDTAITSTNITAGTPIQLTASNISPTNINWQWSASPAIAGQPTIVQTNTPSANFTYNQAGTYQIRFTAEGSNSPLCNIETCYNLNVTCPANPAVLT
ncbi:MAG: hypothetical protein RI894_506, partial [Bacteroidota bacterium]